MYTYKAKVARVIDGDTVVLEIDLGFNIFHVMSCRLLGVNAPELNAKDEVIKVEANACKNFLMSLLPVGKIVTIESKKLDKYGRALVLIDGVNDIMNEYLATCKTFVKK
jgi:micrococcal nuclease